MIERAAAPAGPATVERDPARDLGLYTAVGASVTIHP
jgi:hypothetical protein